MALCIPMRLAEWYTSNAKSMDWGRKRFISEAMCKQTVVKSEMLRDRPFAIPKHSNSLPLLQTKCVFAHLPKLPNNEPSYVTENVAEKSTRFAGWLPTVAKPNCFIQLNIFQVSFLSFIFEMVDTLYCRHTDTPTQAAVSTTTPPTIRSFIHWSSFIH